MREDYESLLGLIMIGKGGVARRATFNFPLEEVKSMDRERLINLLVVDETKKGKHISHGTAELARL